MKTIEYCGPGEVWLVWLKSFCVLKEKISLMCWQLPYDVHALKILLFELAVKFLYFPFWISFLFGFFTSCEKPRAFERILYFLKKLFDTLETNNLTLISMLKICTSLFP